MKKLLLSVFLLAFYCNTNIHAQSNYPEVQLPSPYWMSPLFIGSINESKVYYGKEPNNSQNKPVIVFVHGFIDLANLWFLFGNEMYKEAYHDGYRTAYVALTRGEGMWKNGEILADMLEDITSHYNVNDVVIVAHSNGGKAAEVAMFTEGKKDLVNRVISLGTPFKGTGVADLAETPAFNWLVDFIGLGGGTSTSTTYYMENVARPILDNHPDNQPSKFINFGGWGYNSGTTISAPAMFVGGNLLKVMGGGNSNGGNDGVTPYYSSTRPGGNPIWGGYCWGWFCDKTPKVDHIDIALSDVVWNEITPWIQSPINLRLANQTQEIANKDFVESQFEIISTMDGVQESFFIHPGSGRVQIEFMHADIENEFVLTKEHAHAQVVLDLHSTIGVKGINSTIVLDQMEPGKYTLETNASDFAAVIAYENGPSLKYNKPTSLEEGKAIELHASLSNLTGTAKITGVLTKTNELDGNGVKNEFSKVVKFSPTSTAQFNLVIEEGLPAGVYNLILNAEGTDFRRSLVSGFAVQERKGTLPEIEANLMSLDYSPNPVSHQLTLTFEKFETQKTATIEVFDAYGRVLLSNDYSSLPSGEQQVFLDFSAFETGVYFLRLSQGGKQITKTIVKSGE